MEEAVALAEGGLGVAGLSSNETVKVCRALIEVHEALQVYDGLKVHLLTKRPFESPDNSTGTMNDGWEIACQYFRNAYYSDAVRRVAA
jgi:hypothetical protein